ncbi:RNA-binding cell elongation regulator Jag/EloR [Lactiplantibacillus plantarum]|uniref:RNA-binding cell elongation regulator Jag/EloR n=1 Tax=Lactiplantibacillus plantarum TaxID=1590 RepID=UPI0021A44573|nr:RNA-binding cell elongation regulator Jag/EloR [Lactiplantibacillus plantarum]MCT4450672.1 KH domain-containing protein [Lactiplantibacillus plantarum]MCT4460505.1 KH domain-containing protein [Lactiplantibacillus plantarum]
MTVFEGNTVAAAIAAGLKQLHRTRDQVEVEVIAEAKKGFLGLGKHPAQVRLTVVPASAAPATTPTSATATAQQSVATESTTAPTMPRPTVRTPKSTPTRQAKTSQATTSAAKPATSKAKAVAKPASMAVIADTDQSKPATTSKTKSVAADQSQTPRTPAEIAARQAANETAVRALCDYLLAVVKELGVTADLDVDFGNRYATLNFDTTKQGLLIGKHGRTINALQDLAQVYMNHHGASHVNVVLDVDDYRERRAATLKRLAESTAREVIATGKQVFLDPMPSFERKLIHAELANNHHVTTFSEGRDPHRAVVVAIRK